MANVWDYIAAGRTKTSNGNTALAAKALRKWNRGETDPERKAIIADAIKAIVAGECDDTGKYVVTWDKSVSVSMPNGASITIDRAAYQLAVLKHNGTWDA